MSDAPVPSTTVNIPLAASLPIFLERLRAATVPPNWPERLVTPYIHCEIGHQELYLRRSHTFRSLGTVGFRAPLDLQARQLTGVFERTIAGTVFLALWAVFWLTLMVLTILKHAQSPDAPQNPPLGMVIVVCLACVGLVPFLARAPRSDRHPQRRWVMDVLRGAAGGLEVKSAKLEEGK